MRLRGPLGGPRVVLTVACALAVALGVTSVANADEGWTIERFDSQIVIRADGSLGITEAIDVDFGAQQKHGIFRRIPVRYRADGANERVYDLRLRSVTDATGRSWAFQRTEEGPDVIIKIGDPDRTISGRQTYRIAYDVFGVLNGFADHDELFWNVNGVWPVRTRAVTTHVQLPRGDVTQVACYQGPLGSTEQCRATKAASTADMSATRLLGEAEQMTVVVGLPKGVVPPPKPTFEARARDIEEWWDLTPVSLGGAAAVLVVGIGGLARRWWTAGRDPGPARAVVPEYEPPQKLRPAEVGLLIDESADPKDLTATIVDLAVRGYLRIEEIPSEGILGRKDWKLVRLRDADDTLAPFEKTLFAGLFAGAVDAAAVKLSDLKGTFHATLELAEDDLYKESVAKGWFPTEPDRVRSRWAALGCGVLVAGVLVTAGLGLRFGFGIAGLAVVLVGVMTLFAGRLMAKRSGSGRDLLWHIHGFRRYMETAETDRQRFAEKENIFAQYLPYAIVFGLVSKWAAAFSGLDVQRATAGWYTGSSFVNVAAFSNGLSSFSSGLATAISSTPASSGSSGFGGGGGSGGGGGGGGGGSW